MMIKTWPMFYQPVRVAAFAALLLLAITSCTKPNPRSCTDGACTDPEFPFCDVDGALSGDPMTCVAVSCVPSDFELCRGDQALVCNPSGANYDIVSCQLGCDDSSGGCRGCAADRDCRQDSPICDQQTFECRQCAADNECESAVCDPDNGKCLPEAEVVYASSTGTATSICSLSQPCPLSIAITVAKSNPLRNNVRMLPGAYSHAFDLLNSDINIIGTGAILQADGPVSFNVGSGSTVSVRGLEFDLTRGDLQCVLTSGIDRPQMNLRDLLIREPGSGRVKIENCTASLKGVTVKASAQSQIMSVLTGSSLDIDRSRFEASSFGSSMFFFGSSISTRVTNSLLDNVDVLFGLSDGTSASAIDFAFNTVVMNISNPSDPFNAAFACDFSANAQVRLENNIIVGSGADAVFGNRCITHRNVLAPQAQTVSGDNIIADPKLFDIDGHDFHIVSDSPARDAAVPSSTLDSAFDFEGTPRPQGARKDIGAFELAF